MGLIVTIIRFAMRPSYVVRDRSFDYLPGSRGDGPRLSCLLVDSARPESTSRWM